MHSGIKNSNIYHLIIIKRTFKIIYSHVIVSDNRDLWLHDKSSHHRQLDQAV